MVKFIISWAAIALLIPTTLAQQTGQTNRGDRKVGIVIDESNSMRTNDPNNTRITAALALNEFLVSNEEKTKDKLPDQVTVVGFHDTPELLYPLGDPKGAGAIISNITSNKPGTFIGGGISTATDDLTKPGTGTTANRTGIVVLTDGEDSGYGVNGIQGTINAIIRAGSLGIRVSFGFLSTGTGAQSPKILTEILKTGGTFSTFSNAESQGNFIDQVLLQGLTGMDASSTTAGTLLPGLKTFALLSPDGNPFSYFARANEKLNFTITSLNRTIALKAELRNMAKKTEVFVPAQQTNRTGVAVVETTLAKDANVELLVSANGTFGGEGIFAVGVQSSLGLSGGRVDPSKSGAAGGKQVSGWIGLVGLVAGLGAVGFFF